jgi:TPR repeat protein
MRPHFLIPVFSLSLLLVSGLSAQQSPDPTTARLQTIAHLAALTQSDFNTLSSQARSGDAEAQYWLGSVYEQGRLVAKDSEKASSWFMKSAEQGYSPAQLIVGMMSSPSDPVKAERWFRRAADQGNAEAQFWLGVAYEQGWFGTTDFQEALKWFRKSAEQGHPDAQASLGGMYRDGEGVEQDYALAVEWYRKAAEHVPDLGGAGQGRNELGLLYMQGLGVPKDNIQAYMCFSLAHTEGNLKQVQLEMTPAQIFQAQHMVAEWEKQHPRP